MREAYARASFTSAKRRLKQLVHPGAEASLLKGLEETLTFKNFGLSKLLERNRASTNIVENLNGSVRRMSRRVKNWKGGVMALRWVASASDLCPDGPMPYPQTSTVSCVERTLGCIRPGQLARDAQ